MPKNKTQTSMLALVKEAKAACSNGDFEKAHTLYSSAIMLNDSNPVLYGNRSAVRATFGNAAGSIEDAKKAVQLDPSYVKGYYRLGMALEQSGEYFESLVAFSRAMSLDSKNAEYLKALTDTSLKSSLKDSLEPVMNQLKEMGLSTNPFVVTSVIGQDLLACGAMSEAAEVLECAVTIGTCSLKLKGSVYSALSSALWSLDCHERSIIYMKEDLKISQALSDISGECRAYGNLGAAYLHQGKWDDAVEAFKQQLLIAQKLKHKKLTAAAYSGLGMVCSSVGKHDEALRHHQLAYEFLAKGRDVLLKCRELGRVGQCRLTLGDLDGALECMKDKLQLASTLQDGENEESQAYVDLAAAYRAMGRHSDEVACLRNAANIGRKSKDTVTEAKALGLLGFALRQTGDLASAKAAYERMLDIALKTNDKSLESRSCANLGIVHHQTSDYEMALKLQAQCLTLAKETDDLAAQGRAYGNMGNAYSALGLYEQSAFYHAAHELQAVNYHLKELEMSALIKDKESECSTHGNLAVAYQALHDEDRALHHYQRQHELGKEIDSFPNQSRALMNLGNFHNTLGQYRKAMDFYNEYLRLLDVNPDKSGQCRALYNLGFACFSLKNYQEAMTSYQRSVEIATECQDKVAMARAYCNLGLARKELGQYEKAFDCQKMFLSLSTELKSARGTFKALGNMGDIFVAENEFDQAVGFYQQQMAVAEQNSDLALVAPACASLGAAFRKSGQVDQAIDMHSREVDIYQNTLKDAALEYKAQGRLGAALTERERFHDASACYERQLELGVASADPALEAQALCNLAITSTNLQDFEKAQSYLKKQVDVLRQLKTKSAKTERCKALCSLGECCEALEQYHDAVLFRQMALTMASETRNLALMDRALKGLTSAYRLLQNFSRALSFCQQRLIVCERLRDTRLTAATFGDLAILQSSIGEYEEALQSLKQQMKIGVDLADELITGDAACGLGSVHYLIKDYVNAVKFHSLDLEIAQRNDNRPCLGRAHGNLAAAYEKLEDFSSAVSHQEQHLFIAEEQGDEVAKQAALFGIGRNTLLSHGDYSRATLLLQQAVLLQDGSTSADLSIRIRYYLGIAMWACGNSPSAMDHLNKAAKIAEKSCQDKLCARGFQIDDAHLMGTLVDLFSLLVMCYSALLCVLSSAGHTEEALAVAEKSNSYMELFLRNAKFHRQDAFVGVSQMLDYCRQQNTVLLYFTISASRLFAWMLTPDGKIFSPEKVALSNTSDTSDTSSAFQQAILSLWKSLGIDSSDSDLNNQDNDIDLVEKVDAPSPERHRLSFTEMVQNQHAFQWRTDHLSTGKGCLLPSDSSQTLQSGKNPHSILYDLLISKFDDQLEKHLSSENPCSLLIVASGDLLLVPFCMLRKKSTDSFLSQRFSPVLLSSFYQLSSSTAPSKSSAICNRALVVGNPLLPKSLFREGWSMSQASEDEANLIAGMLRVEPLTGKSATRASVLEKLEANEVVHFSCRISRNKDKFGIVLSCDNQDFQDDSPLDMEDGTPVFAVDALSDTSRSPALLEDQLLTIEDILLLDLTATKLVVLGSPHLSLAGSSENHVGHLASDLSLLCKAFSLAGCRSLLASIWPVPETAAKLVMQTFYAKLLQGFASTEALSCATTTLRTSQQFEHPSYWAGFLLAGPDLRLASKDLSTIHALISVLQGSASKAVGALKMVKYLIHKSIQRSTAHDHPGTVPMYTSQESVSSKLCSARGWRELFSSAGFELRPSFNGLPAAVFFPQTGFDSTLPRFAETLTPFLDLPADALDSIGRLTLSPSSASSVLRWLREVSKAEQSSRSDPSQMSCQSKLRVDRTTWETDGCSQLLQSLGINALTVNEDNVELSFDRSNYTDVIKATTEALQLLFGDHVSSSWQSDCLAHPTNIHSSRRSGSVRSSVSALHSSFSSAKRLSVVDFPVNVDFNVSFQSVASEGSSQQFGSSEYSAVQNSDCGILPLGEPKVFTQERPKNAGLLAPTPIVPPIPTLFSQKAPLASPAKISPLAFSPSKKVHYSASPDKSSPMSRSFVKPTLKQAADGRGDESPSPRTEHVVGKAHSNLPLFYQGHRNPDTKVCVVNPTPGDKRVSQSSESRYMSVFESLLAKNHEDQRSFRKPTTSPELSSASHSDQDKYRSSAGSLDASGCAGAYKPAPSAARALGVQSPQSEYSDIVDKLSDIHVSSQPSEDPALTHTHTAYRLVHSERNGHGTTPKLQAYKVQTVFVPIPTSDAAVVSRSSSSHSASAARTKRLPPPSATSRASPAKSDIFQHLASVNKLNTSEDRVHFV